jgi:curved DNA-binding protein
MIFKDYYKILELDTSKVTLTQIKTAYRKVAKKYHPDVNIGDNLAEERIKDINEAYKVLSNPSAKRKYDRMWNSNRNRKIKKEEQEKREQGSVFSEFFNMFFGNIEDREEPVKEKALKVKGENIETEITISIEEGYFGLDKKISLKQAEGKDKIITVKIPAGIKSGEKIRLIGQGKPGQNGGKNGDLIIKIKMEDSKIFKLQGYDLHTELYLTPWEATLGTKLELNSIDENLQIYVPEGIQSGEKITIEGKGYKVGDGLRGNLVAEVKIMVPKNLSSEEKEYFEKLNEISKFNPRV